MDAVPVISRGHNAVVLLPPVPEAARSLLSAVPHRLIVLAPDAERAVQLAAALAPSLEPSGRRIVAVSSLQRGAKQLAGNPDVAAIGVADALALLRSSSLPLAGFGAVALAWPELLDEDGTTQLEAVMAEVARDAQRLILTADAGPLAHKLIERYAFKAMTFGFPTTEPDETTPPAPSGPVGAARYVIAPAERFVDVRRRVLDALAPASDDAVVVATVPESRTAAEALVRGARDAGGEAPVVVAEPWQLGWLRSLFAPLTPLPVATAADLEASRVEAERARIARVAEADDLGPELMTLAPLLTRFDAAVVAAAALRLARTAGRGSVAGAGPAAPAAAGGAPGASAKLWVGIGRKDNVRPGDLVGALANEAKVPADALGKIEIRDLFCLVEIRADQAERAAKGLTGVVVKGRRLVARVDRGPGAGAHRPPRRV